MYGRLQDQDQKRVPPRAHLPGAPIRQGFVVPRRPIGHHRHEQYVGVNVHLLA